MASCAECVRERSSWSGRESQSESWRELVTRTPGASCIDVCLRDMVKPHDLLVPVSSAPLLRFHTRPINLVVYEGSLGACGPGYLVLRPASRLDAFSGYPFRTWLPGYATGVTTGTPEVRPPRSSRTMGSSSQVSFAHGR